MLKPRIIKKEDCLSCKLYFKALNKINFEYLIYDADLPENQEELDEWKIGSTPIVQIVDVKEDGSQEFVHQFPPGAFSVRSINAQIKKLEGERK